MNPIAKALQDIRFQIPEGILQTAFIQREFGQTPFPVSLDTIIREQVIEGRLGPDIQINGGGNQVDIPVSGLPRQQYDTNLSVIQIPMDRTQNRLISQVQAVSFGNGTPYAMGSLGSVGYSEMIDKVSGVMSANGAVPRTETAYVRLIGPNTILISDVFSFPGTAYVRCILEYDLDYSQLRTTTIPVFSQLAVLAAKALIYNRLALQVDRGQLIGGRELGMFREIIMSYSDAQELYSDMLTNVWHVTSIFDDTKRNERHLRLLVGGRN